ncbi:unnamed protein product [Ranitomeya imitator]|uniref:Uncharacterized protein n=1 Tax=Ranitomeya imitator TaxID=111125 RepID=A0ABN9L9G6_9NEOB|nr:unnamed protein product [Ranitomeya imitator]
MLPSFLVRVDGRAKSCSAQALNRAHKYTCTGARCRADCVDDAGTRHPHEARGTTAIVRRWEAPDQEERQPSDGTAQQDIEKELEVQIGMRQEMEMAMKMLDKDVCEKQDALAALRQQLDDLRALKHELSFKLQSSDLAVKQKTELNSRLEEKTNQMAATIKQLEQRLRVSERNRLEAEEANRLFKQEFGDKIESLQMEVDQLQKQCRQYDKELKKERNRKSSGNQKEQSLPENKYSPLRKPHLLQKNTFFSKNAAKLFFFSSYTQHKEADENVRQAVNETSSTTPNNTTLTSINLENEEKDGETKILQMCKLCREESSILLTKETPNTDRQESTGLIAVNVGSRTLANQRHVAPHHLKNRYSTFSSSGTRMDNQLGKVKTGTTRRQMFLGVLLDSEDQSSFLPEEKKRKIVQRIMATTEWAVDASKNCIRFRCRAQNSQRPTVRQPDAYRRKCE